jgi:hypothetical protein
MSTIVELAQTLHATSQRLSHDGYADESIAVGACADYLMMQERKRNQEPLTHLPRGWKARLDEHCRTIAGERRKQAR